MSDEPRNPGPAGRDSVIHDARRDQVVRSAVTVIAELGVERASVVKIAARAGVSRGVIAYHFADLADLHAAVVAHVYRSGAAALTDAVHTAPTARDALRTFVSGSIDFYAQHPREIAALREIFSSTSRHRHDTAEHGHEVDDLERILRKGQQDNEFRAFDPPVMTAVVRALLDVAATGLATAPNTIDVVRPEILAAVDAVTRREATS